MAITKVTRNLLNTGISDSSDATAITIDSSENVMVGATSYNNDNAGVGLGSSGFLYATRDGSLAASFKRLTSTGSIADFRKDSSTIASVTSDGICFGSDSAAANALDDYEEGTFEADIYSGSTNQVILNAVDAGKYVKIGRFVFITIQIYVNSVTNFTTSSTNNYINLPFVSASDTFNASGFRPMYYNGMGTINAGYISTNTNKMYLCTSQNNILANLAGATTIGGSVRFYGDMTYMSAS
tara:strand:- start:278 stop:997 length:720 start_codon:yes stop_codon:yes gene_type:complete